MAGKRVYVEVAPALWGQVKALAAVRGVTLGAAVTEAMGAWLTWLDPPPRVEREPIEPAHGPATISAAPSVCRRCQHPEARHWARGCVGTCACRHYQGPKPRGRR